MKMEKIMKFNLKTNALLFTYGLILCLQPFAAMGMDQKDSKPNPSEDESSIAQFVTSQLGQFIKTSYRKYCLENNKPAYCAGAYLLYDYMVANPTKFSKKIVEFAHPEYGILTDTIITRSKSRPMGWTYLAGGVVGLKIAYELFGADVINEINERTKNIDSNVKDIKEDVKDVKKTQTDHTIKLVAIEKNTTDIYTKQEDLNQLFIKNNETIQTLKEKIHENTTQLNSVDGKLEKISLNMSTKEQVQKIDAKLETKFNGFNDFLTTYNKNTKKNDDQQIELINGNKELLDYQQKHETSQAQLLRDNDILKKQLASYQKTNMVIFMTQIIGKENVLKMMKK
jgi:hypothetical protein